VTERGELLEEIGMGPVRGEALPGYVAWLPDRRVTLYQNRQKGDIERLEHSVRWAQEYSQGNVSKLDAERREDSGRALFANTAIVVASFWLVGKFVE
jgi:hypothetical protein